MLLNHPVLLLARRAVARNVTDSYRTVFKPHLSVVVRTDSAVIGRRETIMLS